MRVPVIQYVPVPSALTIPVEIEMPTNGLVGECVRVARVRRAALEQCNSQLKAIGEMQHD